MGQVSLFFAAILFGVLYSPASFSQSATEMRQCKYSEVGGFVWGFKTDCSICPINLAEKSKEVALNELRSRGVSNVKIDDSDLFKPDFTSKEYRDGLLWNESYKLNLFGAKNGKKVHFKCTMTAAITNKSELKKNGDAVAKCVDPEILSCESVNEKYQKHSETKAPSTSNGIPVPTTPGQQ